MRKAMLGITAALWLTAVPAFAHHDFAAEFDANKPINLKGTITKVEWANPHVYTYMNVRGDKGQVENWKVEMAGPSELGKIGWTRDALKIGSEISVKGWRAKDGKTFANADTVTTPTGKSMSAGSSFYEEHAATTGRQDNSKPTGTSGTKAHEY